MLSKSTTEGQHQCQGVQVGVCQFFWLKEKLLNCLQEHCIFLYFKSKFNFSSSCNYASQRE